jgi:site-specific recombinase XerD
MSEEPALNLSQALHDYCHFGRHELSHSKATFISYRSKLRQFSRWLEENWQPDPPVQEITRQTIRSYYFSLVNRGVRPRTQQGHLHALRALWGYLVEQGVLQENVAALIPMPKLDATNRKLVSDEEVENLIEATGKQVKDFRCVRDRAVLSVLAFGALRRRELLDLRVEDLNLGDNFLVIRSGKGSKRRQVPLCRELREALTDWLAFRRRLKVKTDRLFTIPGGRPLGDAALTRMVNEVAAIAGMRGDPRIKPHTIRHNAATRMLRNGMDLKSVSVWLGHSELRTTSIYLHSSEQELQGMADLAGFKKEVPPAPAAPQADKQPDRRAFFQQRRMSRQGRSGQ